MGFLERHIKEHRDRLHNRELLETLMVFNRHEHNAVMEDFIDNLQSEMGDDIGKQSDNSIIDDVEEERIYTLDELHQRYRFKLNFSLTTTGPSYEKDAMEHLDEFFNKTSIGGFAARISAMTRNMSFLGDRPYIWLKIYSVSEMMHLFYDIKDANVSTSEFINLGNVFPLTPHNAEQEFRHALTKALTHTDNSSKYGKGLCLTVTVYFNPKRVTFPILLRGMTNMVELMENMSLKFMQFTDIKNMSINYMRTDEKEPHVICDQSGKSASIASIFVTSKSIWNLGKMLFSSGSDTEWDSEEKQLKNDSLNSIYRNVRSVSRYMAQFIRGFQADKLYTWKISGQKEWGASCFEDDSKCIISVRVDNISESRKNTVRNLKEHLYKILESLHERSRLLLRQQYPRGLVFMFIFDGSSEEPERLPASGKYDGMISYDAVPVEYWILDDEPSKYRQYSSDRDRDPETSPYRIRKEYVDECEKFNPTLALWNEENRRNNNGK